MVKVFEESTCVYFQTKHSYFGIS